MKKFYKQLLLLICPLSVLGQQPVYQQPFSQNPVYNNCKGVNGTALDLDGTAALRRPLPLPNALRNHTGSYSIQCWVKAGQAHNRYTILAAPAGDDNYWELGVQDNGAWYWEIKQGHTSYGYHPTPERQSIRNTKWHQLTYCMDAEKQEVSLYYDGGQVAIYNVAGTSPCTPADSLFVGGLPQGDIGEWAAFKGAVDELDIYQEVLSPTFIRSTYTRYFPLPAVAALPVGKELKVMNYNIWHGGNETGKDVGPARIVDIIRGSGADIISMQETYGSGEKIADALGYYFYLRGSNLSIMSRYPIEATLPGSGSFYNGGAYIKLNARQKIAFITNWLSYPFDYWEMLEKKQPLQVDTLLAKMETHNAAQLKKNLEVIHDMIGNADQIPVIFCGDFNSGSHLDWIERTKHLNNGYIIPFPQSRIMQEAGFKDSYREVHPDPLKDRGITWSPQFSNAFKDRIDYIYFLGKKIKPVQSFTISQHPVHYPSDHAALVTGFILF